MVYKHDHINIKINLYRNNKTKSFEYKYIKRTESERPMALDVLLQAQENALDDLAFRYGCRARNCGVCTIDVNNKPRLACRARVKEGDTISAIATLPKIKDLIVKRDSIAKQMIEYNKISSKNNFNVEADKTYHNLTSCIECYACLNGCPLHEKNRYESKNNDEPYKYGNPFSLLKIQRLIIDPLTPEFEKSKLIEKAKDLGLEVCIDCPGCKCGVGINLKDEVIKPLLKKAYNIN